MSEEVSLLRNAFKRSGLTVSEQNYRRFIRYHELLLDWNKRMNLISPEDEKRIVHRHFLESAGLVLAYDFPDKGMIMDIGTGAGFPGVPLWLVRNDLSVILVESKAKRVRFLKTVKRELELEGVSILEGRVESLLAERRNYCDVIIARAVTDLRTLAVWAEPHINPKGGTLLVIKGPNPEKEILVLKKKAPDLGGLDIKVEKYDPFSISLRDRTSTLVVIKFAHSNIN